MFGPRIVTGWMLQIMKHGPILWHTVTLRYCVLRSGFSSNFANLCQPDDRLLRYICMQHNNQSDCADSKQSKSSEPAESEPLFPTSYDWRQSNCDERRSGPCCRRDDPELTKYVLDRLTQARHLALARFCEIHAPIVQW